MEKNYEVQFLINYILNDEIEKTNSIIQKDLKIKIKRTRIKIKKQNKFSI
jgi:hypothetical protein